METTSIKEDIDESWVKTYARIQSRPFPNAQRWSTAMHPTFERIDGPSNFRDLPKRYSQPTPFARRPEFIRRDSESEIGAGEQVQGAIPVKSDKSKQGIFDKLSSSAQKFGKEHLSPEHRAWVRQAYHKTPMHAHKVRRGKSLSADGLTRKERIVLIYAPLQRIEVTREFSLSI
jgi:hypothetical protein